jgi:hypothetical protein
LIYPSNSFILLGDVAFKLNDSVGLLINYSIQARNFIGSIPARLINHSLQ